MLRLMLRQKKRHHVEIDVSSLVVILPSKYSTEERGK
jgi:hypothetical protein